MWVTTHRAWFQEPSKLYPWDWTSFTSAQLVGPGQLNFTGDTTDGRSISWILASDWAELCFTLWSRVSNPQHPQMLSKAWIPSGWHARALAAGHPPPGQE